jgi:alpha-maltose-1-phosphate synthase
VRELSAERLRVLVVAEAANPDWVSVPLVGWSLARALADVTDAHLVTQIRNREAIAATGWREGREFSALDSEAIMRPLWRIGERLRGGAGRGWTTLTALGAFGNYYFEHQVWQRFGARIRAGEFDVVHRVTPLTPTAPSLLASRCRRAGTPFVWGPLNGGTPWPEGFGHVRREENEWLSYVRGLYRWMPGYRSTRRAAAAILIGSQSTWEQMPERYRARCIYLPENAVDPRRLPAQALRPPAPPLRVGFLGRLVPYKCPDLLLEALLPLLRKQSVQLCIIGDGPLMGSLRERVEREDVERQVEWCGWLPHREALERLAGCHVLGFPSIREFGGGVVLEAMALGLAPVVVRYGGPAELVTPSCGYALELGTRESLVRDLHARFCALAEDPSVLVEMGMHARRRALGLFTWEKKAQQVLEVYRWVGGARADRPDFGMPLSDPV